jgi:rubrerythrin
MTHMADVFDSFLRDLAAEPVVAAPGPSPDFACAACGYGVSTIVPPPVCPMCRSTDWEPGRWQRIATRN